MYITNEEIDLALDLGFEVTMSCAKGTTFDRLHRHIWNIRDGWQTVNTTVDGYEEHLKFDYLSDALRRPL